jgi:hypothetical protein
MRKLLQPLSLYLTVGIVFMPIFAIEHKTWKRTFIQTVFWPTFPIALTYKNLNKYSLQ